MLALYRRLQAAALRGLCLTTLAAGALLPAFASGAAPGTVILNQATLSATGALTVQAAVSVKVSSVGFLRYVQGDPSLVVPAPQNLVPQPTQCSSSTLAAPAFGVVGAGSLPTLPATYPLTAATEYQVGEPVFLQVTDPARNLSAGGRDVLTITVSNPGTGDSEVLTLQETAANSGDFIGFINTTRNPAALDCLLSVREADTIHATYGSEQTDPVGLVDPYGVAFDATTGALLTGVTVTLIDETTGLPAVVLGDFGEPYPATVTTGGTVTTGATTYTLRPGEFRFPFVTPGRSYHLVASFANHAFPTGRPDSAFTAPAFAGLFVTQGSRGESFTVNSGLPVRIDLPLDPVTAGLLLVKNSLRTVAAIGDFVPYDLVASNRSGGALAGVSVRDVLPPGFRYRAGSLKVNGLPQPDPQIAGDGRTLDIALGLLANNADARITYVTEVTAATPLGEAINQAQAITGIVRSNPASATVRVREDLMRSRALVMGRVLDVNSCSKEDLAKAKPLAGARIYLEDGRYVLSDVRGRWHFDDLRPGTHVLQLDQPGLPAGAEILECEANTRSAGSAWSRFVDLQGGTLWQADFYVQRARPLHLRMEELQRQLGLRLTSEKIAGGLRYTLAFKHAATRIDNAALQVLVPKDLELVKGSLKLDGATREDPALTDTGWTLPLPELANGTDLAEHALSWELKPAADARPGHHAVRVLFAGDYDGVALEQDILENQAAVVVPEKLGKVIIFRPRFATYSTVLTDADKRWLDGILDELREAGDIRLEIVGHTDNVRVVPRKGRKINDNYALSQARAQSVADYLQEKLGLATERVQAFGKGPDEPIADNATAKGKESNRRVELKVFAVSKAEDTHLEVQNGDSGERLQQWSEWQQVRVDTPAPGTAETAPAPADDGMGLLSHRDGEVLAERIQALRLRVDSRLKTDITLDGKPIPDDRLGFRKAEGNNVLMSYVGVDFGEPGPHVLQVRGVDPFGIARIDQKVTVIVASAITRIRVAKSPDNIADGRTPVAVKVELVDASGRVVPAAVDLRLVAHGGLRPLITSDAERALARNAGKIAVAADGLMKFAPVTRSGLYTIEVAYNNAVEKIPLYVKPEKREWILVALAEGTLAAKTVSGNMQAANAAGASDDAWQDGRTAFFAKGQIQGKWLLTMAYDSNRERITAFGGAINPEQFYTLYADATDPRADAPSKEKLYLRIERDAFYALFGDFDTGMTEVELGRYSRSLTGIKTEYHDARYDVNLFAADTGRGFVRDELRGNGTSGLYRLRTQKVLAGSERVRIETRDRFKSEVVLTSQQLARWADYNIDYHRGELFFKAPVLSQDSDLNPVWIVVEYETELNGGEALNAGGRAAVKFNDGRGVVGVSTVQEENGVQQGSLNAVDASYRVTPTDTVRVELAGSSMDTLLGSRDGNAQLVEWKRDSQKIKGRAYVREQEGGFGLGQQSGTEDGTRKLGVEGRYQLWQDTAITADVFQQEMLTSGASRQVLDLRRETTRDRYAYGVGLRHVDEQMGASDDRSADQLALSGRYTLPNNKVKLRSTVELGLTGTGESLEFPDRFMVGADYQAHKKVLFQLEQEWATSQLRDSENTRFGIQTQPWQGARIGTTLDHETRESGERLRGNLGLGQTLTLTPDWTADFGYDHAATLRSSAAAPFNPALPPAFGPATADFWAANVGGNYRHADAKGVVRVERREADDEKRWNLVGGYYRELNPEIAVAVGLTSVLSHGNGGLEDSNVLLRGSLAWRPDDAEWILLDRLDYGIDGKTNAAGSYDGQRLVNNLNANRRWDENQLALQYGAKFVFDTIDATRYSGYTDLIGVEWRRDLDKRWDVGWQNSVLHSWVPGIMDMSYGLSVGYTPMKNAWFSLGYNFEGFTDADFSAGEYSAQGVYLKLRLKVDQHSIKQIWGDARGVFGRGGDSSSTGTAAPAETPAAVEAPAPAPGITGAELDRLAAPFMATEILQPAAAPAATTPAPVMMKVIDPYAAKAAAEAEAEAAAAAAAAAAAPKNFVERRAPARAVKAPAARAKPATSADRLEAHRAMVKRRVETQERRERLKLKATDMEKVKAELTGPEEATPGKYSDVSLERERRRERKLRRERLEEKKQRVEKALKGGNASR